MSITAFYPEPDAPTFQISYPFPAA